MKEFIKGYDKTIYGRELIGKVSLSQKNIALTLIELEKEGVLKSIERGNRRYYSINFLNPIINEWILSFENLRKIEFLIKNKKLIDLFKKMKGEIVCVFGSYSKEMNRKDSDLDLFVVGNVDSLEVKKMGEESGIDIQLFNVSSKDFLKLTKEKSELFKEILNNHVLINGEKTFVTEVIKWMN